MTGQAATKLQHAALQAPRVKAFLRAHPETVRDDPELLAGLGLRLDAANMVEFGPAALARVSDAHQRETHARRHLEDTAQANFSAQAQAHGAVIDLLESRNHSDLARRIDEIASLRFGLVTGVVALEGPARVPAGWRVLVDGQIDMILGSQQLTLMGQAPTALGLFGPAAEHVHSVALVRLAIGEPARQGLVAFGSPDETGFTAEMGTELVAFLARVVERTAERWPIL
ncbi:MAG: hypothetical protein JWP35_2283 [Caulobacter sp.]|nr:hypothetical protein [Caulobacter sp.]